MIDQKKPRSKLHSISYVLLGVFGIIGLLVLVNNTASADTPELHPEFPLLNEAGENVLDAGGPISTMQTCKSCHDTTFIEQHSFHTDVGLSSMTEPGQTASGRAWDTSPGRNPVWSR